MCDVERVNSTNKQKDLEECELRVNEDQRRLLREKRETECETYTKDPSRATDLREQTQVLLNLIKSFRPNSNQYGLMN